MFSLPHRDFRVALRLEDLASALDAGLDAETALAAEGGRPAGGSLRSTLVEALVARGWRLDPTEQAVLAAAEAGGTLPAALRARAAARRQRAELVADLGRRVRYPALLVLLSSLVLGLIGSVAGNGAAAIAIALALPAGLLGAVFLGRALMRRADFTGAFVPGLPRLLQDAAEIPYLEALAALYAAGVPIVESHSRALRAVAPAAPRARLLEAERLLATGAVPLTQALAAAGAVCPETLQILTPAEQAGQLEEALQRALARRRHTFAVRASAAVRWVGALVYGAVALLVAWIVIDFYSGLYAGLRGRP